MTPIGCNRALVPALVVAFRRLGNANRYRPVAQLFQNNSAMSFRAQRGMSVVSDTRTERFLAVLGMTRRVIAWALVQSFSSKSAQLECAEACRICDDFGCGDFSVGIG